MDHWYCTSKSLIGLETRSGIFHPSLYRLSLMHNVCTLASTGMLSESNLAECVRYLEIKQPPLTRELFCPKWAMRCIESLPKEYVRDGSSYSCWWGFVTISNLVAKTDYAMWCGGKLRWCGLSRTFCWWQSKVRRIRYRLQYRGWFLKSLMMQLYWVWRMSNSCWVACIPIQK